MNPRYLTVARRASHRCEYCRAPEAVFNFPFEVEHILPTSKGGASESDNLALACRSCNLFKSDYIAHRSQQSQQASLLFHPRQHRWETHFRVLTSGILEAMTPEALATLELLRLNSSNQIVARLMWIRLGLFP